MEMILSDREKHIIDMLGELRYYLSDVIVPKGYKIIWKGRGIVLQKNLVG